MTPDNEDYTVTPFPRIRLPMVDGGRMGRQKHTIHGLVEFDVTEARRLIHAHKARTGQALSFTGFMVGCLGRAVGENPALHAYRSWRNQVVIFNDVDVNTLFEVEVGGKKTIRPHILRAVNRKRFLEINQEIRDFQQGHSASQEAHFIDWFVRLPGFARRLFYRALFGNPQMLKQYFGTVMLTAIGMFGSGAGWGLPVTNHTLQLTLGGIARKPAYVGERIEPREFLSVTISLDHDLVDGAPAARFAQRLKELVEGAEDLTELTDLTDLTDLTGL